MLEQQKSPYAGLFYGRYWARTSDPPACRFGAAVRVGPLPHQVRVEEELEDPDRRDSRTERPPCPVKARAGAWHRQPARNGLMNARAAGVSSREAYAVPVALGLGPCDPIAAMVDVPAKKAGAPESPGPTPPLPPPGLVEIRANSSPIALVSLISSTSARVRTNVNSGYRPCGAVAQSWAP